MDKLISTGKKYDHAMKITTQEEADAYFEECVQHMMLFGHSREEAERIERSNLEYWAGLRPGTEALERIQRLFRCSHPIFGTVANSAPTPEEAFQKGIESTTAGAQPC